MDLKLVPLDEVSKSSTEFYLVDTTTVPPTQVPTTVNIAWDGSYGAGDEVPFEITFFDENRELIRDIRYAISFIDENDQVLGGFSGDDPQNPGIVATEGIDVQKIRIPTQGQYRIDILVYGTGLDYNPTYSGIGSGIIELGPSLSKTTTPPTSVQPSTGVPSWIKTSSGFWVDGNSSDDEFVSAIQFLTKEGIIQIPPTTQGSSAAAEIPSWIKTSVGFWVDGNSSDDEFISAMQFLIKEGILRIQS
jgi:hypothetical protein